MTSRKFKPYPTYKDSGVEWVGEIPAHWRVKRLKSFAAVQLSNVDKKSVDGEVPVRLCNYTDVYYNERITSDLEFMTATATPEQARNFSLQAGDVLITKDSEAWTDIAVPAVVVEDLPGVLCGYHLAHVRPGSGCNGAFLSRAFAATGPRDQFQVAANGITRFGLGGDAIRTGDFALPPLHEQNVIAAFLDRETARIDALVAKKERLIELLQEQRTALVTRAVTKGLNPTVPMKHSGVEWLGEIPMHWEVTRSKNLFSLRNVRALPDESQLTASQQYGVIFQSDFMAREGRRVVQVITGAEILKHVEAKDFVISMRSFQGGIEWSQFSGAISSAYVVLAPSQQVWHPFFVHLFKSRRYIQALQSTSDLVRDGQALRFENFVQVALPVVPPQEQRAIAAFLDRETARIDALVGKVRDAIDLLKELRTALISAAVTGKIDVREESLPKESTT